MPTDDKTAVNESEMPWDLKRIPNAVNSCEGLTHIDPGWINAYIGDSASDEECDQAWRALIPQWLELLARDMRGEYRIDESENFTVLQPAHCKDPEQTLSHAERSRDLIVKFWDGLNVEQNVFGKHVILITASQDDYYDYICAFYPDGEFGGSGGVCIRSTGYTHLVVNHGERWFQHAAITHEIAHAIFAQLPLPLWLEEGMVQLVEEHLNQYERHAADIKMHREYWSKHTFAGLWTGSAFSEEGDGQQLAYELARTIVYQLALEDRAQLNSFVNAANHSDAGQAAAKAHLNRTLAECLPAYLRIQFADFR